MPKGGTAQRIRNPGNRLHPVRGRPVDVCGQAASGARHNHGATSLHPEAQMLRSPVICREVAPALLEVTAAPEPRMALCPHRCPQDTDTALRTQHRASVSRLEPPVEPEALL